MHSHEHILRRVSKMSEMFFLRHSVVMISTVFLSNTGLTACSVFVQVVLSFQINPA